MNSSLKVIENIAELLYQELKTAANNENISDKEFKLLKEAAIDTINLKRKIELVRAIGVKF